VPPRDPGTEATRARQTKSATTPDLIADLSQINPSTSRSMTTLSTNKEVDRSEDIPSDSRRQGHTSEGVVGGREIAQWRTFATKINYSIHRACRVGWLVDW